MTSREYEHILKPISVGRVNIRNRVFSGPHGTGFGTDGCINDRMIAYHLERARGGVGLIILEATGVDQSPIIAGAGAGRSMRNADDSVIAPYRRLAEALHAEGTKVFCLLSHSGRNTTMGGNGTPPVAPSPTPMDRASDIPHELETDEIQGVIKAFADACCRCRDGGLDGVALSFAHGNLVQEFLSPVGNDRTDEYGGSEENRLRLAREVLTACRAALGADFTFGIRFSLEEIIDGGYTLADGLRYALMMIEWGKLDFIDISAGTNSSMASRSFHYPTIATPARPLVPLARAMKAISPVPVFCVGKIADPDEAEAILAAGEADMVAMTRAHIAEPEIVKKIIEGRKDDIRACIYCNEACFGRKQRVGDLTCVYNQRSGREYIWPPLHQLAADRRHVVIVGGGPAGMEAARVAAKRGHRVDLYEQSERLGGQLTYATRTPHRQPYGEIGRWTQHQLAKLGVGIHLGQRLDAAAVMATGADAVIVATGAVDSRQPIAGSGRTDVFSAREVIDGAASGRKVVVGDWDGRHMGLSVAELLAVAGHEVILVSRSFYAGMDVDLLTWHPSYSRLLTLGVAIRNLEEIEAVSDEGVTIRRLNGTRYLEKTDSTVLCSRGAAERSVWKELRGRVANLHAIGDCWAPRQLEQAIYEGAKAGRDI